MRSYVIGAAMLFTLTAPALAEEFYIVQNPTTKKCLECLSDVPIAARRCAHCAQLLTS